MLMDELARRVKESSIKLAAAGTEAKNKALAQIAESLKARKMRLLKLTRI